MIDISTCHTLCQTNKQQSYNKLFKYLSMNEYVLKRKLINSFFEKYYICFIHSSTII